MKETENLKKTFNLIFSIILAMVFVTISSLVNKLYSTQKEQAKISAQRIVDK